MNIWKKPAYPASMEYAALLAFTGIHAKMLSEAQSAWEHPVACRMY